MGPAILLGALPNTADQDPLMTETRRLTLVTQSKDRATQLRIAGFTFDQVAPQYDDPAEPSQAIDPRRETRQLAARKALSCYDLAVDGRVLLSADTIVTDEDGIHLGKPTSTEHAEQILQVLIGRPHRVTTGVAILTADEMHLNAESAEVTIASPSPDALSSYLASQAWRGAAGAYRLETLRELGWEATTSLEPVGGLPIALVTEMLRSVGITPTRSGIE